MPVRSYSLFPIEKEWTLALFALCYQVIIVLILKLEDPPVSQNSAIDHQPVSAWLTSKLV